MKEVFSTITSPVFSELAIVSGEHITYFSQDDALVKTLRAMNEIKPFKLVFLLEVSDSSRGEGLQWSAEALELMVVEGIFDFLGSPPTIRIARSRNYEWARPADFD